MSNIIAKFNELRAQLGESRVQISTTSGNQSIIALAKPKLRMDLAKWAEKEYKPESLPAGHRTRVVPIEGATHIHSFSNGGTQALGIARAGNRGASAKANPELVVKHFTYIAFADNTATPMKPEEIIQSQFGSLEAFEKCAFITFETLDLSIALGSSGMYQLSSAKTDEEQLRILNSYTKYGFKRVKGADGKTTVDKNAPLVPVTFGLHKQLIYRGVLFVSDTVATTADGVELSAFETYRCGTNAETQQMVYEAGTYSMLERNATTQQSIQDIASKHAATVVGASILHSSPEYGLPVETETEPDGKSEDLLEEFDVQSATKAELLVFLKKKKMAPEELVGKKVDVLRELASDFVALG